MRGSPAPGTVAWADFDARADGVDPAESRGTPGRARGRRPLPTSCSRRARPASRRARCSPTRRASAPYASWADVVGLREGDRYLIVNPFFHSFGLKAGILACLITGATMIPHPVFDVDPVMQRASEERVSMLPGPPTVYQSILDHPRIARVRHVVAAPRGHGRGRRSRSR